MKISGCFILGLCLSGFLLGQGFDSGSDESDGPLDLTTPGTVIFDPTTFTPALDQDGDGVYHFTTINIASGVIVRLANNVLGNRPVIWLASGAVTISGTLDLSGGNGHSHSGAPIPAVAGAGGSNGGVGGRTGLAGTPGLGPGGGDVSGGHAGHAVQGSTGTGNGNGGDAYGNIFLMPLFGGSGGAGGAHSTNGAGGGAGGGAILLASSIQITVVNLIDVGGGQPGGGTGGTTSAGGYGSGGSIRLMAPIINGSGTLRADGSSGASNGRIRVEAFQHLFTGTTQGETRFVTPGNVFPPANSPTVNVTAIGGAMVPANPLGGFNPADLVINEGGSVTIDVVAENIPVGTVVDLSIWTESTGNMVLQTTPLAGNLANSTATATATFPHGFSRISIQASWNP